MRQQEKTTPEVQAQTGISRRMILRGAAAVTAAAAAGSAMAHNHSEAGAHGHVADSALQCKKDAEACMHHLLTAMGDGAAELSECAHKVSDAMSVCNTLVELASHDSPYLPAMAQLAIDVKKDCATECEKHAATHEACATLARSCRSCITACEEVIA